MLTTDQKGVVAELAIARDAAELGIGVWRAQTVENGPAATDDNVVVRCYSSRRNRDGLLRRFYSADEIDAFAAYCAEIKRCYFLPLAIFGQRSQSAFGCCRRETIKRPE